MTCNFDGTSTAQYYSDKFCQRISQTKAEIVVTWNQPITGPNSAQYKFIFTGAGETVESQVFSVSLVQVPTVNAGLTPLEEVPAREDFPNGREPAELCNCRFDQSISGLGTGATRETITGLTPGTKYVVQAFCLGSDATAIPVNTLFAAGDAIFTYPEQTIVTNPVSGFTANTAALSGTVEVGCVEMDSYANPSLSIDPNYADQLRLPANRVRVKFEWGLTTDYGNETSPSPPIFNTTPAEQKVIIQTIEDLEPNTVYHYRAIAYTDDITVVGDDQTFTTSIEPGLMGVL